MLTLSTQQLLSLWEQGADRSLSGKALILLSAVCPDDSYEVLAQLDIGERDSRLIQLRESTFGQQMTALSDCPECEVRLELVFNVSDITVDSGHEPVGEMSVSIADYDVSFRLPNSHDLESLDTSDGLDSNRQLLLKRCITNIRHKNEDNYGHLPAEVTDAIAEQMAQNDYQADIRLDLHCVSCGHQWQVSFDIVSYFWSEINAWARNIIREVHTLATTYGWSEASILTMSPYRRRLYIEMVGE